MLNIPERDALWRRYMESINVDEQITICAPMLHGIMSDMDSQQK